MNMPMLVDFLLDCGIENPIVCSSINKAGYFMNPDIDSYERSLKEKNFRAMAMSIFASGGIKPKEAVEYVCSQKAIQSIVFGASSKQRIIETKELIDQFS
jgi:phosphoribosylformimino-5-aminoimidazole carboxamide ribonucleotide (ProFAR) isomerase